jgi:hypothetical protein
MTSDPYQDSDPEVARARAELVDALQAIEAKINVPKRARAAREANPVKFGAAVAGLGLAASGILALIIVAAVKRR